MKVVIVAALALAACTAPQTPSDTPPTQVTHFPQVRERANGEMQALAFGELVVVNGCLRIADNLIIWPADARLDQTRGRVRVLDIDTGAALEVGQRVRLSGGQVDGVDARQLNEPIPAACALGPYWIAGSERTVAAE